MKGETESLLVAAKNQSIRTNLVKEKKRLIKFRRTHYLDCVRKLIKSRDLVVSGCSKLA